MTEDSRTRAEFLSRLRAELAGADPALVQDALFDAEEHIRAERDAMRDETGAEPDDEALEARLLERFGSPAEVAAAYRETEARVAEALRPPPPPPADTLARRIVGVFVDPRAYGGLLYMLLALATGILYFTWVVTGISLSLGLSVLIIGLPVILLFLATVRALSLLEGRIVEALLGERMPRRQPAAPPGSLLDRIRYWLTDSRTWRTMLYLFLQLPLGIVYFVVATTLLAFAFGLAASPIAQVFLDAPALRIGASGVWIPLWTWPIFLVAGAIDLLVLLHLAKLVGRGHGALAKAMLVER